jgi:D-alanyl-lipoteichoic acid acyltransferase DltB (MBOAT superfamily)
VFLSLPGTGSKNYFKRNIYFYLFITWALMGLWHGANWTFIIFGCIHAFFLSLSHGFKKEFDALISFMNKQIGKNLTKYLRILFTFSLICFSLFFFRANTLSDSLILINNAFIFDGWKESLRQLWINREVLFAIVQIIFLLLMEYYHHKSDLAVRLNKTNTIIRWGIYLAFIFMILIFGVFSREPFIYFQF